MNGCRIADTSVAKKVVKVACLRVYECDRRIKRFRSQAPALANAVLYVASDDQNGYAYALNASTGAISWSSATGFFLGTSPTVVNGVVYVGSDDHNLYAFDQAGARLANRYAPVERPAPAMLIPDYSASSPWRRKVAAA